jgi:hypothetical protein
VPQSAEQHVKKIEDPNSWPLWPILPLIKRDGSMSIGFLYGDPVPGAIYVWLGVMYNAADIVGHKDKRLVYKDAKAIVADGWEVD